MELKYNKNGISSAFIKNNKFKSALLSVRFCLPIDKSNITETGMVAKLLTSCTANYPTSDKLSLALAKISGAKVSFAISRLGDKQMVTFYLKCLLDDYAFKGEQALNKSTDILKEILFNPRVKNGEFYAEDVERTKKYWLDRIKGEINNKRHYAIILHNEIMFEDEPYGVPRLGYAENAEKADGKALYSAYKNLMENSVIRVTLSADEYNSPAVNKILDGFKDTKRTLPQDIFKTAGKLKTATRHIDITQGKLVMGFRMGVHGTDKDTYINTVLVDIFGGGPYSKLFCEVREKLSLCYYCHASANRQKGFLIVDSGVDTINAETAKDEILHQLEEIKKGNFDRNLIKASKLSIINSFKTSADSIDTEDFWYGNRMLEEDPVSIEEFCRLINSVTKKEIIERAKLITPDTFLALVGEI